MRSVLLVLMLHATNAFAHPGDHHDNLLASLIHLLTEPDHLALAAMAVLIAFTARRFFVRRAKAQRSRDDDTR